MKIHHNVHYNDNAYIVFGLMLSQNSSINVNYTKSINCGGDLFQLLQYQQ